MSSEVRSLGRYDLIDQTLIGKCEGIPNNYTRKGADLRSLLDEQTNDLETLNQKISALIKRYPNDESLQEALNGKYPEELFIDSLTEGFFSITQELFNKRGHLLNFSSYESLKILNSILFMPKSMNVLDMIKRLIENQRLQFNFYLEKRSKKYDPLSNPLLLTASEENVFFTKVLIQNKARIPYVLAPDLTRDMVKTINEATLKIKEEEAINDCHDEKISFLSSIINPSVGIVSNLGEKTIRSFSSLMLQAI